MKSLRKLSEWLPGENSPTGSAQFTRVARVATTTFRVNLELRAADLCAHLVELPSEEAEAFLVEHTQGDSELRQVVETMMKEKSFAGGLLENPLVPPPSQLRGRSGATLKPASEFKVGDRIDDFLLLKILGEGGFAVVYLAKQLSLDREVALKISKNFGEEARILAHLDHESIVKVYSQKVDTRRNLRVLCMQYIRGVTLSDVIASWKLVPVGKVTGGSVLRFIDDVESNAESGSAVRKERRALGRFDLLETGLWIGARLADALHYAHQRGVLHLDVKPSNILLDLNGRPYLTDFNVALDHRSTVEGKVAPLGGTIDYMAPEQAEYMVTGLNRKTRPIDHRADIYALGVVMAELLECALSRLAVQSPQRRADEAARKGEEHPLAQLMSRPHWDQVDSGTKLVLKKCIGITPESRFPDAGILARALDGCLELRQIAKSLPPQKTTPQSTFLTITGAWVAPQLFALVGALFLVAGQSGEGLPIHLLLLILALPLYAGLFMVWRQHCRKLRPEVRWSDDLAELIEVGTRARSELLQTHARTLMASTALWLPATLLLLCPVAFLGAEWNPAILGFVLVVTTLSGLVGCGYASLFSQWLALRALYPGLWFGCPHVQEIAGGELAGLATRLRYAYISVVASPLIAALLIAVAPVGFVHSPKMVIPVLLGLALGGLLIALGISHRISQMVIVFSGGGRDVKQSGAYFA